MSHPEEKGPNWLTIALLVFTVIYPGWFYNNGVYANLSYLPTLSLLLITSSIFSPLLSLRPNWNECRIRCISILKDPILWTFLLFMCYIFVQYINSGAVRVLQDNRLTLKPLLHQHLPFSLNQTYARKALIWTFSCFAVILSIRHGLTKKKSFFYLIMAILANATLLAILGLAQYATHTPKMYWIFDVNHDVFFSTFGYENNGGSFFILMSAVALGGLIFSLFNLKKHRLVPFLFFSGLFGLFVISVFPTFTRFCYLQTIGLVALLFVLIFIGFLKKVSFRKSVSVLAIVVLFTGSTTNEQRNNSKIMKDFKNITNINSELIKREFSVRTWQWGYTVDIWKDYPWFGTGSDNMRYLQGWYARQNKHHLAMLQSPGKSNTHNDGLQYLSELGILGFTLFFIPLLLMLSEIIVWRAWKHGLIFGALLGIGLNAAHSLVDLPYRNGLILFTSIAFIASASTYFKSKPDVVNRPPGKLFKSVTILFMIMVLFLTTYSLSAPLVRAQLMKEYKAFSADQSGKKLTLLNLTDAIWFSSVDVKSEKAKLLFLKWEKTKDVKLLKSAALASHFAYFTDISQIESAFLFSKIMEKLGFLWEAKIALKILVDQNPKNEAVANALYLYHLRHGKTVPLKKKFMLIK